MALRKTIAYVKTPTKEAGELPEEASPEIEPAPPPPSPTHWLEEPDVEGTICFSLAGEEGVVVSLVKLPILHEGGEPFKILYFVPLVQRRGASVTGVQILDPSCYFLERDEWTARMVKLLEQEKAEIEERISNLR